MHNRILILSILAIVMVLAAGCTSGTPPAAETPVATVQSSPAATAPTPMNAMGCTAPEDCVPAQCCHPTSCINKVAQRDCSGTACTMSCEGPLDCGAGSCGCVQGQCSIVTVPQTLAPATSAASVRLWATPQRYSPMMSSTPGVEFSVITNGIDTSTAEYDWTASYGQFLSWSTPDHIVNQLGPRVTNTGEKLYWSFTEKPSSTISPVIVTVVVREVSGKELGRSVATLDWDGDYAVTVREIT